MNTDALQRFGDACRGAGRATGAARRAAPWLGGPELVHDDNVADGSSVRVPTPAQEVLP